MKKFHVGLVGTLLLALALMPMLPGQAQEEVELETEDQQISYTIGFSMGPQLITEAFDVDIDAFVAGLKASLSEDEEEEPALSMQQMQEIMATVQQRVMEEQQALQEEREAMGEESKAEGEAFLEENARQDEVTELPSGLQYKVLEEGDGPVPSESDQVEVHYRGQLLDGTEFDSSYGGDPRVFGVGQLIPGWTEALQQMPVGSKWELYIPSDLAYGPNGRGEIPPNAVLIFEMELLDIK